MIVQPRPSNGRDKFGHKLNVKPDSYDARDYHAAALTYRERRALPRKSDLRDVSPEIYDQGQEGSCTANGWARALDMAREAVGFPFITPSRNYIYRGERAAEGDISQDNGAQVRTGGLVVCKLGAPPETLWPYDAATFAAPPPPAVVAAALLHRGAQVLRVAPTPEGIIAQLAAGRPVVFGFTVFASFDNITRAGIMRMPKNGERVLGGHCAVFDGHTLTSSPAATTLDGRFQVANSWGKSWGRLGRFSMPFAFLRAGYVSDLWVLDGATG